MAFIDDMRAAGHAVESTCRVLSSQGCQVAARTYRAWKQTRRPIAARTVTDAVLIDALPATRDTPEALYGRRKMTHHLRRQGLEVAFCTVDRLMRDLGMNGVRRGRSARTTVPSKDGHRAGDLLNRDFTAPAPNTRGSPTSPTAGPGPGSSTSRSLSTSSPSGSSAGTPPPTNAPTWS